MTPLLLKINEIFFSIQGESLLVGKPTVFVRTSACNLRCVWCDTKYSYSKGDFLSIDEILNKVNSFQTRYVCVTGGEPLSQTATLTLLESLCFQNKIVSLETNGSYSIENVPKGVIKVIDIKCPDSGESDSVYWENMEKLCAQDQLKFVIASFEDYQWAKKKILELNLSDKASILFSPVYGKVQPSDLASWILDSHLPVTLQLQLHKEIWGPNKRGV